MLTNLITTAMMLSGPVLAQAPSTPAISCAQHEATLAACRTTIERCSAVVVDTGKELTDARHKITELERRPASCPSPPPATIASPGWRNLIQDVVDRQLGEPKRRAVGCEKLEYELAEPITLRVTGKLKALATDVNRRLDEVHRVLPSLMIERNGLRALPDCVTPLVDGYGLEGNNAIERNEIRVQSDRLPKAEDCGDLGGKLEHNDAPQLRPIRENTVPGFWVREGNANILCRRDPSGVWTPDRTNTGAQDGLLIVKVEAQ